MHEKCNVCSRPSKGCIPFLMSLSTPELLEWCRYWKDRLGWSNAELAKRSGVPKGTVDRVVGHSDMGVALVTIRPIICAIVSCSPAELAACSSDVDIAEAAEGVRLLQEENQRLRNNLEYIERLERKDEATIGRMEQLLRTRNRYITALFVVCVTMVLALVYYLTLDISKPNIGLVRSNYIAPLAFVIFAVILVGVGIVAAAVRELLKNKKG